MSKRGLTPNGGTVGAGGSADLVSIPSATKGEAHAFGSGSGTEVPTEVKDAMDLKNLVDAFRNRFYDDGQLSFAVESEDGPATDYAIVGLNLADVVRWQVLGLSNPEEQIALWTQLEGLAGEEDGA